eukprot:Hpha_TRINITY_DN15498_c2_g8::TRINITY_DN15498_c2_g8_i1::g.173074::m.173074
MQGMESSGGCSTRRLAQLGLCAVAALEQPGEAAFVHRVNRRLGEVFAGEAVVEEGMLARALSEDEDDGDVCRADKILHEAFGCSVEVMRNDVQKSQQVRRLLRIRKAAAAAAHHYKPPSSVLRPGLAALVQIARPVEGVAARGAWFRKKTWGQGVAALCCAGAPPRAVPQTVLACLPSLPISWSLSTAPGGDVVLAVVGVSDGAGDLRALLTNDQGIAAFTPVPARPQSTVYCHEGVLQAATGLAAAVKDAVEGKELPPRCRLSCVGHGVAGGVAAMAMMMLLGEGGPFNRAIVGDVALLGTPPFLTGEAPISDLLGPGAQPATWVVAPNDPLPFVARPALVDAARALSSCAVPPTVLQGARHQWLARYVPPTVASLLAAGGERQIVRRLPWGDVDRGTQQTLRMLSPLGMQPHRLVVYASQLCEAAGLRAGGALETLAPGAVANLKADLLVRLHSGHLLIPPRSVVDESTLRGMEEETLQLRAAVRAQAIDGGDLCRRLAAELLEARRKEAEYNRAVEQWEEERLRRDTTFAVLEAQVQSDRSARRTLEEQCQRQLHRISALEADFSASRQNETELIAKVDAEVNRRLEESRAWYAKEVRLEEDVADLERAKSSLVQRIEDLELRLDEALTARVGAERSETEETTSLRQRLQELQERFAREHSARELEGRAATEAEVTAKAVADELRRKLRDVRLEAEFEGKRAEEAKTTLREQLEVSRGEVSRLRKQMEDNFRSVADMAAEERTEAEVRRSALEVERDTLGGTTALQQEQIAQLAARLKVSEDELAIARRLQAEKEQLYLQTAVTLKAERTTLQTRIGLLEEDLETKHRRVMDAQEHLSRARKEFETQARQERARNNTAEKESAEFVKHLEGDLEAVTWQLKREKGQRAEVEKELSEVQEAKRTREGELVAEVEQLRSRIEELDVVVTKNLHYRILKEQKEQHCEELDYLRNRVKAMEASKRSLWEDEAVLGEQRWRDAEARALRLQSTLNSSEMRASGAEQVLTGIAPLLADNDVTSRLPDSLLLKYEEWRESRGLAQSTPSAIGRRRLDPLASPPSVGAPAAGVSQESGKAASLRKQVEGSAVYGGGSFTTPIQRSKEIPCIYDTDW